MIPLPGDGEEGCTGGCTRIQDGFLTQRTAKGSKKRWVVFQGDTSTGIFQLKVFKHSNERILKIAHTISKDTFVGIERGDFEDSTRRGQKPGKTVSYLAILLVTDTILLHDDMPNLVKWHSGFKKYFHSNSWEVVPMTGVATPESKVVLHITQHAISLATINPPKHYQRWQLGKVTEYGVWGARVYFEMDSSETGNGYFEIKASTLVQANSIGDTISSLLPNLVPGTKRRMSRDGFTTSPFSPRLEITDSASDDKQRVFKFPPSRAAPISQAVSPGPTPPLVSPRTPSTLLSTPIPESSPKSPQSPLKLGPPPVNTRPALQSSLSQVLQSQAISSDELRQMHSM
ncbi:uncharacterized protein LOC119736935 [Patiria miniata]|uniref:IRS-type PTB domain-containing protein n=1 Tax=Patiria miniata TaxID=46514 RepID=A0A914AS67_PATMI|nr:uncharacterized protein LOC119736935 [Patiria miniata]